MRCTLNQVMQYLTYANCRGHKIRTSRGLILIIDWRLKQMIRHLVGYGTLLLISWEFFSELLKIMWPLSYWFYDVSCLNFAVGHIFSWNKLWHFFSTVQILIYVIRLETSSNDCFRREDKFYCKLPRFWGMKDIFVFRIW